MNKFTHWVFDMDGTIIDSSKSYELSLQAILQDFNITPSTEDMIRAYKFFNPQDYFATFNLNEHQINSALEKLILLNQAYADKTPAFQGIEDLFIFLKSQDVRISVWTGRELYSAQKLLENTNLQRFVDQCVSRSCVQKNKPHPDGLLKILKDSKHKACDVVMIGDHDYDLQGAQAAQVKSISVNWEGKGHISNKEMAFRHFDRISDFHQWTVGLYS